MGRRLKLELVDGCHESWEAMPSAGGGRACARCERDVIDLDGKTMKQAAALLVKEQALRGSVCARFPVDENGEAKFAAPLPTTKTWLRGVVVAATIAAGCESVVQASEPKPVAVVIPLAPTPVAPPAGGTSPVTVVPLPPPPPLLPPIAAAPDAGVDASRPGHPTHPPTHLMGRIAFHQP